MTPRRLWLIDAGYLFMAQRSVSSDYSIDYLKLRMKLEETGEVWRAYYLNATPNATSDVQDNFHNWLRSAPPNGPKIITKLYPLRTQRVDRIYCATCNEMVRLECPNDHKHQLSRQQQKGVDVGIATLALTHADLYDSLVLSSGDGDLIDAVEYLSEKGKKIELLVFNVGVSTELQSRADSIHWIDDFKEDVRR